ncbi:hypothetical protein ACFXMT_14200 [Streptomyces mirabilis]|uniref:hypothetical protein n=1 Tax=Streptomyces mirabilis TaxID=68239 RepID=UPI0036A547BC
MRLYRKSTKHPICVYLTDEEALSLAIDAEIATATPEAGPLPTLEAMGARLDVLLADPKKERA